jgi:hypothetical protein
MSGLLLSVLERLPSRVRRGVVAAGALLALAAVMAALTLTAPHGDGQRRQPVRQRQGSVRVQRTSPPRIEPPVSTTAILQARRVAQRFLAGFCRSRTAATMRTRSAASPRRCAGNCFTSRRR